MSRAEMVSSPLPSPSRAPGFNLSSQEQPLSQAKPTQSMQTSEISLPPGFVTIHLPADKAVFL